MACSGSDPALGRHSAIRLEIRRVGGDPTALIEVLHRLQLREGYLAAAALHQVACELGLPLSRVFGVASFYHLFRLSPPPRHRLALCLGTACFVNGAERLEAILLAEGMVDAPEGCPARPAVASLAVASSALASSAGPALSTIRDQQEHAARPGPSPAEAGRTGSSSPRLAASPLRSPLRSGSRSGLGTGEVGEGGGGGESGWGGGGDPCGGWRLERSGCLGACGIHPVLRLDDGMVIRVPLTPAADLLDRLQDLGLPLLPASAP